MAQRIDGHKHRHKIKVSIPEHIYFNLHTEMHEIRGVRVSECESDEKKIRFKNKENQLVKDI